MLNLNPFTLIVRAIVFIVTIPVHEAAHAWAADRLGDPTARYRGRLTLNPAAHFDLMGCIAMLLFGIGWAKPVPINPMNFENRKKGMALSAAAGPLSNILLATVSLIFAKLIISSSAAAGAVRGLVPTSYQSWHQREPLVLFGIFPCETFRALGHYFSLNF